MAKVKGSSKIAAAHRRADVVAYLNSCEQPQPLGAIAEHFNWTPSLTRSTLDSLKAGGIVNPVGAGKGRGQRILYATKPVEAAQPQKVNGELVEQPVRPIATRKTNGNGHRVPDPAVELVLGGVTAIIDRNPANGRPRVTFQF